MVRDRLRRRRTPVLATLLLVLAASIAACDSEADTAAETRPDQHHARRAHLRRVGERPGDRGVPERRRHLQRELDRGPRHRSRAGPTPRRWRTRSRPASTRPTCSCSSRADLAAVTEEGLNRPLLELVDERGVDFGDGYSRDAAAGLLGRRRAAVHALRRLADGHLLQQGPDRLRADGASASCPCRRPTRTPGSTTGGASRSSAPPRSSRAARAGETKGIHVEPTLRGLAPFVYAGGGDLFNSDSEPTSLDFSSDETRDALTPTLELLRDPALTLTEEELARGSGHRLVQAGQARDDRRLPARWCPSCAPPPASTST